MSLVHDMADVIALLSDGSFTVKRRGPTTYVDGIAQPQVPTTLTVTGTLVPVTALEALRLPEGIRDREMFNLFTVSELKSTQGGVEPDAVVVDGRDYSVEKVERWDVSGNYFKATLVRPLS